MLYAFYHIIYNIMSDIGTTSILFDETRLCTDFSFNDDPTIDPDDTFDLTDPNSSRDALQRLRILKTRNTGSVAQLPITLGRVRSKTLDFSSFTYEQFETRRKIEVLKGTNKNNQTKKQQFSRLASGKKTRFMTFATKQRLQQLRESNQCTENRRDIIQTAASTNGGGVLYYDTSVPFHLSL